MLEITFYNVSAGLNYYLSNKREEGGGERERNGERNSENTYNFNIIADW